ncbi:MAG: hypothetical protein ABIR59_11435 [Gemmatimonadales bacterium]
MATRTAKAPTTTTGTDLLRMKPGKHPVVTCYLKIEPRDRARKKYLVKLRNRVRDLELALDTMGWDKSQQDDIRADLARVIDHVADEATLPSSQGIAIFASRGNNLFEVKHLPLVHRSRLVVDRTPLVRELASNEEEFGKMFTITSDRASALIWEVTAFDAKVVRKIESEVTRGGRYHSDGGGDANAEHAFHNRIQNEKRRHLEAVARALFELERSEPGHQIVLAGVGADAGALEPFLHNYVADRLIGVARLAPRDATPAAVHALSMEVREAHARASEAGHVEELAEGLGTGWAVNGVKETLRALSKGQIRTLLVRHDAAVPGFRSMASGRLAIAARELREDGAVIPTLDVIDDAIEEALRQRVALDVVYDAASADAIDGIAGLLRFK